MIEENGNELKSSRTDSESKTVGHISFDGRGKAYFTPIGGMKLDAFELTEIAKYVRNLETIPSPNRPSEVGCCAIKRIQPRFMSPRIKFSCPGHPTEE